MTKLTMEMQISKRLSLVVDYRTANYDQIVDAGDFEILRIQLCDVYNNNRVDLGDLDGGPVTLNHEELTEWILKNL
jgi:hypothetical protein